MFLLPAVKNLTKHSILLLLSVIIFYSCKNGSHTAVSHPSIPVSINIDSEKIYQGLLYHRLDTYFLNRFKFSGFNGNVLITKGPKIIYKGCFGYACYETHDTLTPQTSFQIASTSKTFTATAILYLAQKGSLSLDDDLQKFFPNFPYKNISIKLLLAHRSGLPNYLHFGESMWKDKTHYITNDALLQLMTTHPRIEGTTTPNTHFEYCNTNYALLASVIEKVSGKSYPQFMVETFFKPLGMKNTWVYNVLDSNPAPRHAISYNSKWKIQNDDIYDGVYGDKGIHSTVEDMMLWDASFYSNLLSEEMKKEAYSPRSFERKGVRNYGYGWRLMKQPNGEYMVYHNGWWHGNNTVFFRSVKDSFALIILSNRYNPGVYNVQPIFNILGGTKDTANYNEGE